MLSLFLEFERAKKLGQVEVGPGKINRCPGEPVGMGGFIGTFVKIRPPYGSGFWFGEVMICSQDKERDPVLNDPCGVTDHFGIYDLRHGVCHGYHPLTLDDVVRLTNALHKLKSEFNPRELR
jgi:hypothetical protein